jgi:hypothetical protein
MCCFSKPVLSVSSTSIFARAGDNGHQFLVYSMSLDAKDDLAMILPLPVKTPAGEKDVQFIDLKGYSEFFDDLRSGFPIPVAPDSTRGGMISASRAAAPLEVVQVGDFEASFVPTVKDFSRLDERFRLPDNAWKDLPAYSDYGFAVFKLKSGAQRIHPMAFSFPNRDARLFFPTVHIHDGKVHNRAKFDHTLYCQPHGEQHLALGSKWEESTGHARRFMKSDKGKGILEPDQHCYRRELHGSLRNVDTFVSNA